MKSASETAFVTGATGFLGWEIARQLIEEGTAVRALSRSGTLPGDLEGRGIDIVQGDLDDVGALAEAMAGCRLVFHVAADVGMWPKQWAKSYAANVVGTRNMVEAALRAKISRLVFTSSASTIGKPLGAKGAEPPEVDETSLYNLAPLHMVYPHTKWLSEQEVRRGLAAGLDAVITHPTAVFGPRDWKHNLLPLFKATRGLLGMAVPDGLRTVCDVRDVAKGHLLAAEKGRRGEAYILGGESVSVRALFEQIAAEIGGRRPRITLPDSAIRAAGRWMEAVSILTDKAPLLSAEMAFQSTLKVIVSSAKAEHELGYRCRPARESIHDTAAWYAEQGLL